jgi:predicted  nucleic acid-binding Zn-ribbon protein
MPQGSVSTQKRATLKPPDNLPGDVNVQENPAPKLRPNENVSASPVERTTARVGGPNELQLQLSDFVKAAAEKGFTPSKLAKLCERLDKAEKKHGLNYDELETKLDELGSTFEEKSNELKKLNAEVAKAGKKNKDLMERYHLEEQQIEEYADAKNSLFSIGLEIETLPNIKNCLLALKEQNFDPTVIIDKLNTLGNLEAQKSALENKLNTLNRDVRAKTKKLKDLEEKQNALQTIPPEPQQEKQSPEVSVETAKESSTPQLEEITDKTLSSISEIAKEASLATEDAKKDLEATLSELRSSVSLLANELKESLKEVGPQMKNVSQAIEAARAIGKYEAILPLFKLTDSSQSNKITETEALVALWNVANAFSSWIKDHYPDQELEVSEPLEKLLQVLDEEIKGLGLEPESESKAEPESESDPGQ